MSSNATIVPTIGVGFGPSCAISQSSPSSTATPTYGTVINGSISLNDIACSAYNCCISTRDPNSVPPDTCVKITSMTGWTLNYSATCTNDTAALLAMFKMPYCDDSKVGPFITNLMSVRPQFLNLCLDRVMNSIAFGSFRSGTGTPVCKSQCDSPICRL